MHFPPFRILTTMAALGLCLHAPRATAAVYSAGDLLMGFVAGSGTGANETLVVNLGPASSFRDAFDGGTIRLNFTNIGTQLNAQFSPSGTPWYERTDLYISLFASTASDTIGDTLVSGDPFRTIYVSRSRTSEGALPSPFTIASNTAITTSSAQIVSTSGVYAGSAADTSGVAIIADAANTLDKYTKPFASNSFTNLNGGIEQAFSIGTRGNFGPISNAEAALDLQRLQAVNNIPGQYGESGTIRRGDFTGIFTIDSAGSVSFVPEPGSASILALTGMLLLSRRRRA